MDVLTLAARPDLEDGLWDLTRSWPRFMLQDPIADLYYAELDRWSEHVLIGVDAGSVVARGFSLAFAMEDEHRPSLPLDGWDGMVRWSYLDRLADRPPTHAAAVEVAIAPEAQGTGLATRMVQSMIDNVDRLGFRQLLAPVRPSAKHTEPETPMEEYVRRLRPDGLPDDPWMRVHARLGAETITVCPRSMTIPGTLAEWREWTGQPFDASGSVAVPGALVPVHVDVAQDHAVYVEPNVWMEHRWKAP
jgi:GNAT superfamily N-acetyltransferase